MRTAPALVALMSLFVPLAGMAQATDLESETRISSRLSGVATHSTTYGNTAGGGGGLSYDLDLAAGHWGSFGTATIVGVEAMGVTSVEELHVDGTGITASGGDEARASRFKVEANGLGLLRAIPLAAVALGAKGSDKSAALLFLLPLKSNDPKSGVQVQTKDSIYFEIDPRLGRETAYGMEYKALVRKEKLAELPLPGTYLMAEGGFGMKVGKVRRIDGTDNWEVTLTAAGGVGICGFPGSSGKHKICAEAKGSLTGGYKQTGVTGETGVYYTAVAEGDADDSAKLTFEISATAQYEQETSASGTYKDARPLNIGVTAAF